MGLVNYKGNLPVAIILVWRSDKVPNPLKDTSKFLYAVANEQVGEFTVRGQGGSVVITRKPRTSTPLFDPKLMTYATDPVSGEALDRFLALPSPSGTIELTFSHFALFEKYLEQASRSDSDLHNLANPTDADSILSTLTEKPLEKTGSGDERFQVTCKQTTVHVPALPFKLVDKRIGPGIGGGPPSVTLKLEIDFLTGLDDRRRKVMRSLIAMDWTSLALSKLMDETKADLKARIWWTNVLTYLGSHLDTVRAERFVQSIFSRHKMKAANALARDLRADIDLHLITANAWLAPREDPELEKVQNRLSTVFGALFASSRMGSPVHHLRALQKELRPSMRTSAGLFLLCGVGHCGEHARVSFEILKSIIDSPGSSVRCVVRTGNANVDHAFVVYNLRITTVLSTRAVSPKNTSQFKGSPINLWDLRKAIEGDPTAIGYVMDPYLAPRRLPAFQKPAKHGVGDFPQDEFRSFTANELLKGLNSPERRRKNKDTDFLVFEEHYPAFDGLVVEVASVPNI